MESIPMEKTKSLEDDAVSQVLGKSIEVEFEDLMNDGAAVEERVHQPQYSTNSNLQSKSPLGVSTREKDVSTQKGTKCKLLHWIGSGQVVAEAKIDCTNPQAFVHHKLLGLDYWRVCVKKIMASDVPLIRDTSELQILEDARGTYIASPSKYITY
ncbi:hypothetical protein Dsin_001151 [Dipteronia sinensis]|uniref:DUF8039 domain-containing protein n=1 Tax=Dipteronia sinensis TaxID=43782 RepID=A0AAE0EK15_9ROSI|nr:hypothetical protein Dsin_001151 [Dipteronia sinensis]